MIEWRWYQFSELTVQALYAILALREDVFVIEQHCLYRDLDGKDQHAEHLCGWQAGELIAYCRVLPEDISYPDMLSIGRIVTAQFTRGKGVGRELITQALAHTEKTKPTVAIKISAQYYLERFYHSFGFITQGEPYDEDGILHIAMVLTR